MKKGLLKWCFLVFSILVSFAHNAQNFVLTMPNTDTTNCNGIAKIDTTIFQSTNWYWTNSSTNVLQQGGNQLNNLCAGTYMLKYNDSTNTLNTYTFNIVFSANNQSNCASLNGTPHIQANSSQNNNCNGLAWVMPTGGTAPYTFQWSNTAGGNTISTNDSIHNACSGNYIVKITDANNCFKNISMFVPQDSSSTNNNCTSLNGTPHIQANSSQNNNCNGLAWVMPSGGNAPYTFQWSNSAGGTTISTNDSLKNACSGNYFVKITDANNCFKNISMFVPQDSSSTNNNCTSLNGTPHIQANSTQNNNCNGLAWVMPTGGTAPYTFQWSNTAGGTTISTNDSIHNACSGNYFVKITDANNCFKDISMFVPQDTSTTNNNPCANFTANFNTTPTTDSVNCNGRAYVTLNGGAYPWSFSWNSSSISGTGDSTLCSGTYTCVVTDANNCTLTLTGVVPFNNSNNNPCPINNFGANFNTLNPSTDTVNCNGMVIVVANGVAPYNYIWSQSSSLNGPQANNLCPGNYSVIVKDGNNCIDTLNFDITLCDTCAFNNPCANFTANLQIFPTTDSTSCNGGLNVFTNGGAAPYNFSWSIAGINTPNANNLCIGNYTVTIADANACTVTLNGYVPFSMNPCANSTLQVTLTSTNVTANPCNGSIISTVNGGIGQYYYLWNTGATSTSLSSVCQGMYSLTVKDSLGCQRATSIYVGQAIDSTMALNAYVIPTAITQAGICDGSASVVAFGGVTPYTYAFDNGTSNQTATSLCSGLQNVTVTDAAGSSITLNFIISSPQNVIVNTTYQDSTVVDSLYNPAVSNCTIDYSTIDSVFISNISFITADSVVVSWTVNYGGTSSVNLTNYYVILNSASGVYNFVIQLYCPQKSVGQFLTASSQYYIDKSALGITSIEKDPNALVYPNPFNDNLSIALNSNLENTITISDLLGKVVYSSNINAKNITIDTKAFSNGNYILTIENKEGRFNYKLIK